MQNDTFSSLTKLVIMQKNTKLEFNIAYTNRNESTNKLFSYNLYVGPLLRKQNPQGRFFYLPHCYSSKSLLSHCHSVHKHSDGCNFDSILMKFCTVILGSNSKTEFVWGKNLITPPENSFPYFTPIFKNLHYDLWGL